MGKVWGAGWVGGGGGGWGGGGGLTFDRFCTIVEEALGLCGLDARSRLKTFGQVSLAATRMIRLQKATKTIRDLGRSRALHAAARVASERDAS